MKIYHNILWLSSATTKKERKKHQATVNFFSAVINERAFWKKIKKYANAIYIYINM